MGYNVFAHGAHVTTLFFIFYCSFILLFFLPSFFGWSLFTVNCIIERMNMSAFNKYILIIALYFYCCSSPQIVLFFSAVHHIAHRIWFLSIANNVFVIWCFYCTVNHAPNVYRPISVSIVSNSMHTYTQCTKPYKYLQRNKLNNINNILMKKKKKCA